MIETVTQAQYGSDLVVDLMRTLGIRYVTFNPEATFKWLHDSNVNYGGNHDPEVIQGCHEETSIALAHGATAIDNSRCDRAPVIVRGQRPPALVDVVTEVR